MGRPPPTFRRFSPSLSRSSAKRQLEGDTDFSHYTVYTAHDPELSSAEIAIFLVPISPAAACAGRLRANLKPGRNVLGAEIETTRYRPKGRSGLRVRRTGRCGDVLTSVGRYAERMKTGPVPLGHRPPNSHHLPQAASSHAPRTESAQLPIRPSLPRQPTT